jgi:hypothetical protein
MIFALKNGCSLTYSTLECKKEHTYHLLTNLIKNAHDNRFGIKNSQFFSGIFYGNKMSKLPYLYS